MRFIRFIKALITEIKLEARHQLWMSKNNSHPDYLDFAEFLQDAECYRREMLLSLKIESMTNAEWEVYKQLHYK